MSAVVDLNVVLGATGLLQVFNDAAVLVPADIHVARCLTRLGGEADEQVALAAALAVRAPRYGHVYVDLATIRHTATDIEETADLAWLPWPDPVQWVAALSASGLVAVGPDGPPDRPLRLIGSALYLDRYWRDEGSVAIDLLARARSAPPAIDESLLVETLGRLFPGPDSAEQRWAAAAAAVGRLTVIAGGPGTGKTTTVARLIALLYEVAARTPGARVPLIGLVAPTGKASARMEEAVRSEAAGLPVEPEARRLLAATSASTVHRLLGKRPGSNSRFRHDRQHRLPHDVLVIDETSMVPLTLMARICEAVRPDARLVLVGDPQQLASVEAGAVLGDIVGPALQRMRISAGVAARLGELAGAQPEAVEITEAPDGSRIGDRVMLLRANHRFGGAMAGFAAAIREGGGDDAIGALASGDPAIEWLRVDPEAVAGDGLGAAPLGPLRRLIVDSSRAVLGAADIGDGPAAMSALQSFRMLCAHRRGPWGVRAWTQRIEAWLATAVEGFSPATPWYLGRPVMVTANDYGLRLFNGDTGVVVARPDEGVGVVFRRADGLTLINPSRLGAVETVFAMTVHKAQGSEFDDVAVVLPAPESPVLTRELLYTAVTRARRRLIVVGSEESVRAAVSRPISRASGLTERLWR